MDDQPTLSPQLIAGLREAVENQLRDNTPREARFTLDRLIANGISHDQAMKMIGAALLVEMRDMMVEKRVYNAAKYIALLNRLPMLDD